MLQNYIKIAFRNLKRFKFYSFINIIGLALGLTVGVLILLFVSDELQFDEFHSKKDRIFKVVTATGAEGGMETNAWPVAAMLKSEYPEVEEVLYTRRAHPNMMVNLDQERIPMELFYAGSSFFTMFDFALLEGSRERALLEPWSIVISEKQREQFFSGRPALGKTLILRDSLEFTVTGVVADIPEQSHIQFDALASFSTYERLNEYFSYSDGWGNFNVRNYVMLKQHADIRLLATKSANMYMENVGDWMRELGMEPQLAFIPLPQVYLDGRYYNGFGPSGSQEQLWLVSAIALFVILLACINYINLSTARAVYRAKEVGMRKIVGSSRAQIFWQFQIEVLVLTLISFALVALFIDLVLPFFNDLMGKEYAISALLRSEVLIGVGVIMLGISILAGLYPSYVLSGFRPAQILKANLGGAQTRGLGMRRALVIFQFAISGTLVMATFIVVDQLRFMKDQNLGFDKEQVLVLDITNVPSSAGNEAFVNEISTLPFIEHVSYTNALPGRPGWQGQLAVAEGKEEEMDYISTEYMIIDENYLDMLGLELIAGENFDLAKKTFLEDGLIINETTVREMGWSSADAAIGQRITSPSRAPAGQIIGVVKDYHGLGLQDEIWPKAMDYRQQGGNYYAIRFRTGNTTEMIQQINQQWKKSIGEYAFDYYFLDDDFDQQYRSEDRLMKVFILFALLTVIIASIGLLGLVSFIVLSRTREIGIRKVLGANTSGLVTLISREFLILVLLANILIVPLVWIFGNTWLKEFAYHTSISPMVFTAAMVLMLGLTLLIVAGQTFHAARQNPVKTLRSE